MPTSYSHGFLARNLDRRTARPAGIVYWLDDAMLALTAAGSRCSTRRSSRSTPEASQI